MSERSNVLIFWQIFAKCDVKWLFFTQLNMNPSLIRIVNLIFAMTYEHKPISEFQYNYNWLKTIAIITKTKNLSNWTIFSFPFLWFCKNKMITIVFNFGMYYFRWTRHSSVAVCSFVQTKTWLDSVSLFSTMFLYNYSEERDQPQWTGNLSTKPIFYSWNVSVEAGLGVEL